MLNRTRLTFRQHGCGEIAISPSTLRDRDMWHISSDNLQRAKDQLEFRRTEIAARYAEENHALEAELAVIETLERAASDFMLRHAHNSAAIGSGSMGSSDPAGSGNETGEAEDRDDRLGAMQRPEHEIHGSLEAVAPQPTAEGGPAETGDAAGGLDILKPGSRWRLYRGASRPADSEGAASEASTATE
jgi:hypothetical protein